MSAAGLAGDRPKGPPTEGPEVPKAPPGAESKGEAPETRVARPWKVRGAGLGGAGGTYPKGPAVGGACTGCTRFSLGLTGAGTGTLAVGNGAAGGGLSASRAGAGAPRSMVALHGLGLGLGLLASKSPSSTSSKSLMDLRRADTSSAGSTMGLRVTAAEGAESLGCFAGDVMAGSNADDDDVDEPKASAV